MTHRIIKLARQLIVIAIGLPITIIGIILVPLPGPGLVVMFIGLFILSLEFEWAKKYVQQIKAALKKIIATARAKSESISQRDDDDK